MQSPDEVRESIDDVRELAWVRRALASGEAKQIRLAARLTTGDVAAAVRVTPPTVWRWEQRARLPRNTVALRYARLLRSLQEAA